MTFKQIERTLAMTRRMRDLARGIKNEAVYFQVLGVIAHIERDLAKEV
jgi:hypothetical protein